MRAWETASVLAEIQGELGALYQRARGSLMFLSTVELTQAIEAARQAMRAALDRPLRQPLPPEVAERAGTTPPQLGEAEKHGLQPEPGGNILKGTIRFKGRNAP